MICSRDDKQSVGFHREAIILLLEMLCAGLMSPRVQDKDHNNNEGYMTPADLSSTQDQMRCKEGTSQSTLASTPNRATLSPQLRQGPRPPTPLTFYPDGRFTSLLSARLSPVS